MLIAGIGHFMCLVPGFGQTIPGQQGVQFCFRSDAPIRGKPAIAHGRLFFGNQDGKIYCIDASSGHEYWHFTTGGAVPSCPLVDQGLVYFVSRDRKLYAVNILDGHLRWQFGFGKDLGEQNYWDYFLSSPIIAGSTMYVGSGDGFIYAFEKRSGRLLWKYNDRARIRCQPVLTEDMILFGDMKGFVNAIHKHGKLMWRFATDGVKNQFNEWGRDRTALFYSPSVNHGIVTIGGWDDMYYGIDLKTGQGKWKRDYTGAWVLTTGMKDSIAYAGMGVTAFVQAVNERTGESLWTFKTKGPVYSYFTFSGSTVFFTDLPGNIFGIDKNTGVQKWLFPIGRSSFCTPVIVNQLLYCGAEDGNMYAIHLPNLNDTSLKNPRRIVYWEGKKTDSSYGYFNSNFDLYIRDFFRRSGYELMDSFKLKKFMGIPVGASNRSVVVFADNRFPASIIGDTDSHSLIRKYLENGGKVVLLGTNPLLLHFDSLGRFDTFTTKKVKAVFDIDYSTQDYNSGLYAAKFTKDGNQWNLRGFITGYWPVTPHAVTTVLAIDDYGNAPAWVKNYGGPEGTGFVQLNILPGGTGTELSVLRAAIEFGITW